MLAAACCYRLSREIKILRSCDRPVVFLLGAHVSGRKIDRRVLAVHIDAELGLITSVWDQMTRRSTPERSYTGVQSDSSQWRR